MSYTAKDFKRDMLNELKKGYDPYKIGHAAWMIYFNEGINIDDGIDNKIMTILVMEEGPEFQMTEEQFREFLDNL